jgi:nucleoside-diphosphate-sugar epimerase
MTDGLRIAVLGAGYIGSAFACAAASANPRHAVCAVRRTAFPSSDDGVTWLSGDISRGAVDGLPHELDVVVLTVAPSRGVDTYERTYLPAATSATEIAKATGAQKLLYTSSTSVYGGRDGVWVTEQSARLGAGDSNVVLCAAEDVISGADGVASTVLRVAGIYGPGRDPRARMRVASKLPQRGEYWVNLAHRDDIVSAMLHVMGLLHAPPVLNVCDGTPHTAADVARWLATARGESAESLVFGNLAERSRNDQRVSSAALVASGWTPRYPTFADGFTCGM